MNQEHVNILALELLRSSTYSQDLYVHNCGAPACIAGHAAWHVIQEGEVMYADRIYRIISDRRGAEHEGRDYPALIRDSVIDLESVASVDRRAYEWLGVDNSGSFHERYRLFSGDPTSSWPDDYAKLWSMTETLGQPLRMRAQSALAASYLLRVAAEEKATEEMFKRQELELEAIKANAERDVSIAILAAQNKHFEESRHRMDQFWGRA